MKVDVFLYALCGLFIACYIWFLPSHSSRLILNLATDEQKDGLLLSASTAIEQTVTLPQPVNTIVLPVQISEREQAGTIVLSIGECKKEIAIASISANQAMFLCNEPELAAGKYTARLTMMSAASDAYIRIPYAFGKYANLSGTVTQFRLDGTNWKQTDTRHGNVALQFYHNPL